MVLDYIFETIVSKSTFYVTHGLVQGSQRNISDRGLRYENLNLSSTNRWKFRNGAAGSFP